MYPSHARVAGALERDRAGDRPPVAERSFGGQLHNPAQCIRAVEQAGRSLDHFDALGRVGVGFHTVLIAPLLTFLPDAILHQMHPRRLRQRIDGRHAAGQPQRIAFEHGHRLRRRKHIGSLCLGRNRDGGRLNGRGRQRHIQTNRPRSREHGLARFRLIAHKAEQYAIATGSGKRDPVTSFGIGRGSRLYRKHEHIGADQRLPGRCVGNPPFQHLRKSR